MTSNLAGDIIREGTEGTKEPKGTKGKEEVEKQVWDVLHMHFRPEFLNRLDAVVIYNALTPRELVKIAEHELEKVKLRMAENSINIEVSEDLAIYFAEVGFDPIFGARPLRRAIEEKLVDEIAMRIIEGNIKPGDTIKPTVEKEKNCFINCYTVTLLYC
jgi:ATP-dependent Clp protease ATP-binding subunit ClpA